MKATIDLPRSLALRLKITAARQGKRVKAVATETFRSAMTAPANAPRRVVGHRVKLPLIQCHHPASPAMELTAEKVAEVLLEQEVHWLNEAARR